MTVLIDVQGERTVSHPGRALAVAMALGLSFDFLVWRRSPGLGLTLFVLAALGAVTLVARWHGHRPDRGTQVVTAATVLLAAALSLRADPVTTGVNLLAVMLALTLATHGFGSSAWASYRLVHWFHVAGRLAIDGLAGGPRLAAAALAERAPRAHRAYQRWLPLIRGAGITVPVVAVLGLLLVSADAVFAERIGRLAQLFSLPDPAEAVVRLVLAGTVAYGAAGAFAHLSRGNEAPPGLAQPPRRPLGLVEAITVLGGVNVLFTLFVALQVRYLFGGADTLALTGLTHAEYARRGFAELVVVAVASLLLQAVLAALTRREARQARRAFTFASVALTLLVLVILASAFQRLLLYEAMFGFTRARMLAHVFMIWLGLLLVAVAAAEAVGRLRQLSLVCAAAVAGFALTLNGMGIDGLVARHNLQRAQAGAELDTSYLAGLSVDAVPALAAALPELEPALATGVLDVLACHRHRLGPGVSWRSAHLAEWRAHRALGEVGDGLDRHASC